MAKKTLTNDAKEDINLIRDNLRQGQEGLNYAQEIYKYITDAEGTVYVNKVWRRAYVGVEYRFEARSESELKDIKADIKASYSGSASAESSFDYLRKSRKKFINTSVNIVSDGFPVSEKDLDAAFQEIDLWDANLQVIQSKCLAQIKSIKSESLKKAPIVKYSTVELWKVLGLWPTVQIDPSLKNWITLENQRNAFLMSLYKDFLYLQEQKENLDTLYKLGDSRIKHDMIESILEEKKNQIRIVIDLGKEAMKTESSQNLDKLIAAQTPTPIIDYSPILPTDRAELIDVDAFNAIINTGGKGPAHPGWWGSTVNLKFSLSTPVSDLIRKIVFDRVCGGNVTTLYEGPYRSTWVSGTIRDYPHIGAGSRANARNQFTKRFTGEDANCKYMLTIYFIDNHMVKKAFPKWKATY